MSTNPDTESPELAEPETQQDEPQLNIELKVDAPSSCERHVTVTIAEEDVKRYFDEAFSELMPKASLPGFRPGRAPRKLVEQRFRKDLMDQVKSKLLTDSLGQVLEELDLSAISEPDFDFEAIEVPESGPMTFEFDIEVRPEFDLPNWKGLKLEKYRGEVSPEHVDQTLRDLVRSAAEMVPAEGPAQLGDRLTVNLRVTHGGQEVAKYEGLALTLAGALSFPDSEILDFDDLMAGAKPGDKRQTQAIISHDAPVEDLQGEKVDVEIELVAIERTDTSREGLADVLKRAGLESEGELRDLIRNRLERQIAYESNQRIRTQIVTELLASADWELPPELVKRQASRELQRAILELQASGFPESEIQLYRNELQRNSVESTTKALREHFILERVAEEEEIDVEPEDYDEEVQLIAEQRSLPPRRVRAQLEKSGMMDSLRNQILERKAIERIANEATFKEVPYRFNEKQTEAVSVPLTGEQTAEIPTAKHGGETQPLKQPVERG